jgi:hypothetical protein
MNVWMLCYTGSVQQISLPKTTFAKMECWGAQGGNSMSDNVAYTNSTGLGAYTCGILSFSSPITLYIYVGSKGANAVVGAHSSGGYNGGGTGAWDEQDDDTGGGGGGSTDIRLTNGNWDNFNSLKSRIMVAAGGGGRCWRVDSPGYGGGIKGGDVLYHDGSVYCAGGTQTSKIWGHGDNAAGKATNDAGGFWTALAGGGGGYYGGNCSWNASSKTGDVYYSSASGGSSFISGHTGCNAIKESSTSSNIIHTEQPNHYSGYVFSNTVMKAGNVSMPKPTGGTETGHSGNGYCKITWHPSL